MGFFDSRRERLAQQQLDQADQDAILTIAERCLPVAVQCDTPERQGYAYEYVQLNAGFREVRVFADGTVAVTEVTPSGDPLPDPLPPLKF